MIHLFCILQVLQVPWRPDKPALHAIHFFIYPRASDKLTLVSDKLTPKPTLSSLQATQPYGYRDALLRLRRRDPRCRRSPRSLVGTIARREWKISKFYIPTPRACYILANCIHKILVTKLFIFFYQVQYRSHPVLFHHSQWWNSEHWERDTTNTAPDQSGSRYCYCERR